MSEPSAVWPPAGIATATLFVADLEIAADFYRRMLGAQPVLEDPHSRVFRCGATVTW